MSVLLERRGTGTQMYFEHAQVGSASLHDYATGWQSTFGKLERALNSEAMKCR